MQEINQDQVLLFFFFVFDKALFAGKDKFSFFFLNTGDKVIGKTSLTLRELSFKFTVILVAFT